MGFGTPATTEIDVPEPSRELIPPKPPAEPVKQPEPVPA